MKLISRATINELRLLILTLDDVSGDQLTITRTRVVSVPDPTPTRGRGSGVLRTISWA